MASTKTDTAGRDLSSDTVFMIVHALFNGWVCAPKHMDIDAVQAAVDRDVFPAGTTAGWRVEKVEQGDDNQLSPGLCADDCDRQHWMVVC